MSDVFISYKREDEVRVGRLARALEKAGLDIWWDRGLPGGESWRTNIVNALDAARCVVVVWSHGSVGIEGAFVRDEATRAMSRGILVPVMIDRVAPPLGFGELQAIDLTHWRGAVGELHVAFFPGPRFCIAVPVPADGEVKALGRIHAEALHV